MEIAHTENGEFIPSSVMVEKGASHLPTLKEKDEQDEDVTSDQGFDFDDGFLSESSSSFSLLSSPSPDRAFYKYSADDKFDRKSVTTTLSEPLECLTENRSSASPTLSNQIDGCPEDEGDDRDSAYSTFIPGNSSFNFSWPTITNNNNGKQDQKCSVFDFSNQPAYKQRQARCSSTNSRGSSRISLRPPAPPLESIYEDAEDETVPPDGGYGWFVALGAFLVQFWSAGLIKTYGLIFMEVINSFPDSSNSTASWIPSLLLFTSCVLAPFVSTLCSRFSCRKVVVAGGLICFIAMILSYLATSLSHLFLSIGLLLGIGSGMSQNPGVIMISEYFSKRKALANSICWSGNAVGGLLLPILIEILISEYGFRGTMLIMGALLLHICVGGLLYLPIDSYHKHKSKRKKSSLVPTDNTVVPIMDEPANKDNHLETGRIELGRQLSSRSRTSRPNILTAISEDSLCDFQSSNANIDHQVFPKSRFIIQKVEPDNVSHNLKNSFSLDMASQNSLDQKTPTLDGSIYFPTGTSTISVNHSVRERRSSRTSLASGIMRSTLDLQMDANAGYEAVSSNSNQISKPGQVKAKKSAFNLDLLRNKTFLVLGVSVIFMSVGTPLTQFYIPSYALALKASKSKASFIVSMSSGIDLLSRLFIGWFSDKDFVSTYKVYAFSAAFAGVSTIGIALSDNYLSLVCFSCLYAVGIGSYVVLLPTVLIENHGSESIGSSWALIRVFQGLVGLIAPPTIGTMIDAFGSFQYGFYLMGFSMIIGSIVMIFIRLTYKH